MAARSAELLPVPYFHIVFTLPHELSSLVLQNKRLLYDLLFRASAATLLEVARDPKHLGADIGLLSVLHTFKEKRYAQTEQILKDVIQRFTKALGADNINTSMAEIRLGRTLLRDRRYREAEGYTRTGYEVLAKQTNPATGWVRGAREDLVEIYNALKQPEEAQKFKGELQTATAPAHQ